MVAADVRVRQRGVGRGHPRVLPALRLRGARQLRVHRGPHHHPPGCLDAARRELEEETGYSAAHWQDCGTYLSSPGLTGESFTLLKATGLTQVSAGGGTPEEDIKVHRVALADLPETVARFRQQGFAIDVRLLILLGAGIMGDNA